MHSSLGNSDKLNLVDFSTFQIQQNSISSSSSVRNIRNAKYRKKHQNCDLLALIAATVKEPNKKTLRKKRASLIEKRRAIKKNSKSRKIRKKVFSRMKKAILKQRKLKSTSQKEDNVQSVETYNNKPNFMLSEKEESQIKNFNNCHVEQGQEISVHNQQDLDSIIDQMQKVTLPVTSASARPLKYLHSRRFREYCDNCTTNELAAITKELLGDLTRFQKRAFQKNPIKAKAHRRIVVGFREVQNNLQINKIKLVLIATDCEKCGVEGGIDDAITSIKAKCKSSDVPYAFPMQRHPLAYAVQMNGCVSCVGILNYDGACEKFGHFIVELEIARAKYASMVQNLDTKNSHFQIE